MGHGTDKIGMEKDGFWAIDYNGNYVWDGVGADRFAGFGADFRYTGCGRLGWEWQSQNRILQKRILVD